MENPICESCGGQTENIENDRYECIYCGNVLDEYGDVVYEV